MIKTVDLQAILAGNAFKFAILALAMQHGRMDLAALALISWCCAYIGGCISGAMEENFMCTSFWHKVLVSTFMISIITSGMAVIVIVTDAFGIT